MSDYSKATHSEHLLDFLWLLRMTQVGCDISIVDAEQKHHKAHTVIIAAFSGYFKSLLHNSDVSEKKCVLKDISGQVLTLVLDFVYMGEIYSQGSEESLERAASLLEMPELLMVLSHRRLPITEVTTECNEVKGENSVFTAPQGEVNTHVCRDPEQVGEVRSVSNEVTERSADITATPSDVVGSPADVTVGSTFVASLSTEETVQPAVVTAQTDEVTLESDKLTAQADEVTLQSHKLTAQADEVTLQSDKLTAQADEVTLQSHKLTAQTDEGTSQTEQPSGVIAQSGDGTEQTLETLSYLPRRGRRRAANKPTSEEIQHSTTIRTTVKSPRTSKRTVKKEVSAVEDTFLAALDEEISKVTSCEVQAKSSSKRIEKKRKPRNNKDEKPDSSEQENSKASESTTRHSKITSVNKSSGKIRGRPRKVKSPGRKTVDKVTLDRQEGSLVRGRKRKLNDTEQLTKSQENNRLSPKVRKKHITRYECPCCVKVFVHFSSLQLHMTSHRSRKGRVHKRRSKRRVVKIGGFCRNVGSLVSVWKCSECKRKFNQRSEARLHFLIQHGSLIRCKLCRKRFTSLKALANHRQKKRCRVTSGAIKWCTQCGRQFLHQVNLDRHLAGGCSGQGVLPYRCSHCTAAFTSKLAFTTHLSHHGLNHRLIDLQQVKPAAVPNVGNVYPKKNTYSTTKTGPMQCEHCLRVFSSIHNLNQHMKKKHDAELYVAQQTQDCKWSCEVDGCVEKMNSSSALREHMKLSHPDTVYMCPSCKYSTPIKSLYDSHLRSRHDQTSQTGKVCDQCQQKFTTNYYLRVHMYYKHKILHPSLKVHRCSHEGCEYFAFQRYIVDAHMAKHKTGREFECPICGRKLKREKNVQKHIDKVHTRIRPFICEQCGSSYAEESELKTHMARHSKQKPYNCTNCSYSSSDKSAYFGHMWSKHKIQVDDKHQIFQCEYCPYTCDKQFRFKEHLTNHVRERQFSCPECGKNFIKKSTLRGHIRWVHREKSFHCDHCDHVTATKSSLREHIRLKHTHCNVNPYKCAHCEFRCQTLGNCRKHMKAKHKGQPAKVIKVCDIYSTEVKQPMNSNTVSNSDNYKQNEEISGISDQHSVNEETDLTAEKQRRVKPTYESVSESAEICSTHSLLPVCVTSQEAYQETGTTLTQHTQASSLAHNLHIHAQTSLNQHNLPPGTFKLIPNSSLQSIQTSAIHTLTTSTLQTLPTFIPPHNNMTYDLPVSEHGVTLVSEMSEEDKDAQSNFTSLLPSMYISQPPTQYLYVIPESTDHNTL